MITGSTTTVGVITAASVAAPMMDHHARRGGQLDIVKYVSSSYFRVCATLSDMSL